MIIIIDTDKIAQQMVTDNGWSAEDFADRCVPDGFSNALLDEIGPVFEEAVYLKAVEIVAEKALRTI